MFAQMKCMAGAIASAIKTRVTLMPLPEYWDSLATLTLVTEGQGFGEMNIWKTKEMAELFDSKLMPMAAVSAAHGQVFDEMMDWIDAGSDLLTRPRRPK